MLTAQLNLDLIDIDLNAPVLTSIGAGETVETVDLVQLEPEQTIVNAGTITDGISDVNTGLVQLLNTETGTIGNADDTQTSVALTGLGAAEILNFGTFANIAGGSSVQLGMGDDVVFNFGTMDGSVSTSGGFDIVGNFGTIAGDVRTGSGNDGVYNTGMIGGDVNLGDGSDVYSVSDGNSFNTTEYSAGRVMGGNGSDRMFGGANADMFEGGRGADFLRGHGGDDVLNGGQGLDNLQGGHGNDRLIGGLSKDKLDGGNGDDALFGGAGRDLLIGGRGDDDLTGGSGADVFQFTGRSGADTITDLKARDKVDLVLGDIAVDDMPLEPVDVIDIDIATAPLPDLFDLLVGYMSDTDEGAKLDLDGFFSEIGLTDRTGGGSENSITFSDLMVSDLSADQFVL